MKPIKNPRVAGVYESYPRKVRQRMLALRELIFETAASTGGVGSVEETLKWGEPAFLTTETGSGSTIRIVWKPASPDDYAVCFHCQTTLVSTFRGLFPKDFEFDGNRRLVLALDEEMPAEQLRVCVAIALTYHLHKRSRLE